MNGCWETQRTDRWTEIPSTWSSVLCLLWFRDVTYASLKFKSPNRKFSNLNSITVMMKNKTVIKLSYIWLSAVASSLRPRSKSPDWHWLSLSPLHQLQSSCPEARPLTPRFPWCSHWASNNLANSVCKHRPSFMHKNKSVKIGLRLFFFRSKWVAFSFRSQSIELLQDFPVCNLRVRSCQYERTAVACMESGYVSTCASAYFLQRVCSCDGV